MEPEPTQTVSKKDIIDMIIETYDPKILEDSTITSEEIKNAFFTLSETNQAKIGKRKVLFQLIFNHKNRVQKPTPEFIIGPHTLTCHWNKEYKKMIYIFGEYHSNNIKCDDLSFLSTNSMLIEDFIYKLIDKTNVFIDIFLEISAMEKKALEYDSSFSGITNSRSLSELFNKLQKCIQFNTRHDNACRLSRVNYFDVRSINNKYYDVLYDYIFKILYTLIDYDDDINELSNRIKKGNISKKSHRRIKRETINETYQSINTIIETNKVIFDNFFKNLTRDVEYVEQFWLSQMYDNVYVNHELTKISDEILVEEIKDFFEKKIREQVYLNKNIFDEYVPVILNPKSYTDYINAVHNVFNICLDLISLIPDMYTICRMFKDFNIEKPAYKGSDYKDQPNTANNIIIYAGDSHCKIYREFLDNLDFKNISAPQNSEQLSCVDLRKFPLPFFSITAINNYYIEKKEDAIVQQLKDDEKHIIELYESSNIDKQDAIKKLRELVIKYREYKFIGMLKTRTIYNKLNIQFEDLRKKLAELEETPFIRSFEF